MTAFVAVQTRKTSVALTAVKPGKETQQAVQQVKSYSEADLVPAHGKTKELYEALRDRVLKLDEKLRIHTTKTYIAFRHDQNWRNIFSTAFRVGKLRIEVFRTVPSELNDPEDKLTYIKESVQYWNQHVCFFEISDHKDLEYAIYLLQQVIERFRSSQEK